jgi:hypothetical protein
MNDLSTKWEEILIVLNEIPLVSLEKRGKRGGGEEALRRMNHTR